MQSQNLWSAVLTEGRSEIQLGINMVVQCSIHPKTFHKFAHYMTDQREGPATSWYTIHNKISKTIIHTSLAHSYSTVQNSQEKHNDWQDMWYSPNQEPNMSPPSEPGPPSLSVTLSAFSPSRKNNHTGLSDLFF